MIMTFSIYGLGYIYVRLLEEKMSVLYVVISIVRNVTKKCPTLSVCIPGGLLTTSTFRGC